MPYSPCKCQSAYYQKIHPDFLWRVDENRPDFSLSGRLQEGKLLLLFFQGIEIAENGVIIVPNSPGLAAIVE